MRFQSYTFKQNILNMAYLFYVVSFTLMLVLATKLAGAQIVGICKQNPGDINNTLSAKDAVSLYQERGFAPSMMMHDPAPSDIEVFTSLNITMNLLISNGYLEAIFSTSASAREWVMTHIIPFYQMINFEFIVVGDEGINGENRDYDPNLVHRTMSNIHEALMSFGLEKDIKVSTMMSAKSLSWNSGHPSQSAFSRGTDMLPIVEMLSRLSAPLLVNVYPHLFYEKDVPLPYALISKEAGVVRDGELEYHSLFDEMVDSVYGALEKVGAANVQVVTETGWPVDGRSESASVENAKTYANNLMDRVGSGLGTPMRPGWGLETYLHTLPK